MTRLLRVFSPPEGDKLQTQHLPSTERMELNYRTRPISAAMECRLLLLVLLAPAVLFVLAPPMGWLFNAHAACGQLALLTVGCLLVHVLFLILFDSRYRFPLAVLALVSAVSLCGWIWQGLDQRQLRLSAFALVWILAYLIALQVTNWMLVAPEVDPEKAELWRFNLPKFLRAQFSFDCPELLSHAVSPVLLSVAWYAADYWVMLVDALWLWPAAMVVTLVGCWLVWHVMLFWLIPWPKFLAAWRSTIRALVVFVTYDPYQTPAPGIFRFPTRWLRPLPIRWLLVVLAIMLIGFLFAGYPVPVGDRIPVWQWLLTMAWTSLMAPLVFVAILWSMAGTLLVRFEMFVAECGESGGSAWDAYVGRIINSADSLERDHLFLGITESGDYPVLAHREICDQHFHLLGDTGARKTSLGMSPLATQLIARGDSTVVVIDLKGDHSFLHTCRLEARRAHNMRFRWLSNVVDQTTFGFNPFLQSHNRRLTLDQLTQQILQGLSLDFGIEYGKGYYTAMNEIVLTTLLKHHHVRSFRELAPLLGDKDAYGRIGNSDDWKESRQLGALVNRLSSTEALNIMPGMYGNRPAVHAAAIDVQNLFQEPQVVYLSLSSAAEPTNAPAIARLFLWACFTAASQQPANVRTYFLIDEFQQVISEGIKLIFEQFRGIGGTIVAAHQTAAQLRRLGTDLGGTIDSCTAIKQVYRASDLESLERLERLSGTKVTENVRWDQPFAGSTGSLSPGLNPRMAIEGKVTINQSQEAEMNLKQIMQVGARGLSSLVRFGFDSGYTCFGASTLAIRSLYPINREKYDARQQLPWPRNKGAVRVPRVSRKPSTTESSEKRKSPDVEAVLARKRKGNKPVK